MREALYQQPEALQPTARKVKAYVKSVFGARSDEYRQVGRLKFNQYD